MNTNNPAFDRPHPQPAFTERLRHSKALIPTMAVMAVTVLALAATLVVSHSDAQSGPAAGAAVAGLPATQAVAPAESARAPARLAPGQGQAPFQGQAQFQGQQRPQAAMAQAPVCGNCGTVESVTPVQRAAPTSGVGAVAGGVVGGLLGNQVGGGNGRAAMTVLGAVGGGFAGNAIEKNVKKQTSYQMRIRMHDGSVRTVEQATAVGAGSRVVVQGNSVRPA